MARMVIPFDSWNIFRNLWLPTTEQAAVAGHNTRVVGGLLPDTKPSSVGAVSLATESAKDSFCRLPSVPSVYLILGAKSQLQCLN